MKKYKTFILAVHKIKSSSNIDMQKARGEKEDDKSSLVSTEYLFLFLPHIFHLLFVRIKIQLRACEEKSFSKTFKAEIMINFPSFAACFYILLI